MEDRVATTVFVLPIIPGEDRDREKTQHLAAPAPEHDGYVAARRSRDATLEAVWHQRAPMGTFAIVLTKGEDINAATGAIITDQDPFNTQFWQLVKEVPGVDPAGGPPASPVPTRAPAASRHDLPAVTRRGQPMARSRTRRCPAPRRRCRGCL
jgi:hypothetical protein